MALVVQPADEEARPSHLADARRLANDVGDSHPLAGGDRSRRAREAGGARARRGRTAAGVRDFGASPDGDRRLLGPRSARPDRGRAPLERDQVRRREAGRRRAYTRVGERRRDFGSRRWDRDRGGAPRPNLRALRTASVCPELRRLRAGAVDGAAARRGERRDDRGHERSGSRRDVPGDSAEDSGSGRPPMARPVSGCPASVANVEGATEIGASGGGPR